MDTSGAGIVTNFGIGRTLAMSQALGADGIALPAAYRPLGISAFGHLDVVASDRPLLEY